MLHNVEKRPKAADRVERKCHKCGSVSASTFNNHINSTNNQSEFVEFWHCPSCFRSLDAYKQKVSKKTSLGLKKKFKEDPEYLETLKSRITRRNKERDNTWTKDQFIERSISIHGCLYDYSKVDYKGSKEKVEIICKKHGSFFTRPSHHIHFLNGCPSCNNEKTSSSYENIIYDSVSTVLKVRHPQIEVIRNDRNILDGLEIDIWIPEFNLGIETHGAYYHSYNKPESTYQRNYHSMKSSLAHKKGINLLQFVDLDVVTDVETNKHSKLNYIAFSMIMHKLGMSITKYARCMEVIPIDDDKQFFDLSHFHGSNTLSKVTYGLREPKGNLWSAMMSFKDLGDGVYEINRFTNLPGWCVVGGFSKLLTHFIRNHNFRKIVTYVDRSFTTGENCYSKFGMKFCGITKPGYRYYKNNKLFSRHAFQKHKLADLLDDFDESLSEAQNMFNNGFRRLWDAGNLRYELEK